MKEGEKKELEKDLKKLAKKYNIKNFAFSGNDGEEYIGLLVTGDSLLNEFEK